MAKKAKPPAEETVTVDAPAPEAVPEDVKELGRKIERLSVKLSGDELKDRSRRLAQVEGKLEAHKKHADLVKGELKTTEARLKEERAHLANIVLQESEPRDVLVKEVAHFAINAVKTVRDDTGEVIETRAMLPHERQADLPLGDDAPSDDEIPFGSDEPAPDTSTLEPLADLAGAEGDDDEDDQAF